MICHEVFLLFLGPFLLQDMSLSILAFEEQSLIYSVNRFQNKVDN